MWIQPYNAVDVSSNGAGNAYSKPADQAAAGSYDPHGRGAGSEAEVHFTPGKRANPGAAGQNDDEVLLHELAHALRQVSGAERLGTKRRRPVKLQPMEDFDTVEEFFCIAVANAYSSETGRIARGDHQLGTLSKGEAAYDSALWQRRIDQICAQLPHFTADMAAIPRDAVPFNPFRRRVGYASGLA